MGPPNPAQVTIIIIIIIEYLPPMPILFASLDLEESWLKLAQIVVILVKWIGNYLYLCMYH